MALEIADDANTEEAPHEPRLEGKRVCLHALVYQPALNRRCGRAGRYDASRDRYDVRLDGETGLARFIRPANLFAAVSADDWACATEDAVRRELDALRRCRVCSSDVNLLQQEGGSCHQCATVLLVVPDRYCSTQCQTRDWTPRHKEWHREHGRRRAQFGPACFQQHAPGSSMLEHFNARPPFEVLWSDNYAEEAGWFETMCGLTAPGPPPRAEDTLAYGALQGAHCAACQIAQGLVHLSGMDFRRAERELRKVTRRRPEIPDTYFYLAGAYAGSNRPLLAALMHLEFARRVASPERGMPYDRGDADVAMHEKGYAPGCRGWIKSVRRAIHVYDDERFPTADFKPWWGDEALQAASKHLVAFLLGALFSGWQCRVQLLAGRRAATVLQAIHRGLRCRAAARTRRRTKQAVVTLQAFARACSPRRHFVRLRALAVRVQARVRGRHCRREWPRMQLLQRATLDEHRRSLCLSVRTLQGKLEQSEQSAAAAVVDEQARVQAMRAALAMELRTREELKATQQAMQELQQKLDSEVGAGQSLEQKVVQQQQVAKDLAAQLRRQATSHATDLQVMRASVASARRGEVHAKEELAKADVAATEELARVDAAAKGELAAANAARVRVQGLVVQLQQAQASLSDQARQARLQEQVALDRLTATEGELARARGEPAALHSLNAAELEALQRSSLEAQARMREAHEARIQALRQQEESALQEVNESLEATINCSICMAQPKDVLLQPCGHWVLCFACAGQVEECPVCRARITQRLRAHLS